MESKWTVVAAGQGNGNSMKMAKALLEEQFKNADVFPIEMKQNRASRRQEMRKNRKGKLK